MTIEPLFHRGQRRVTQILIDQPPEPWNMREIARLAVAPVRAA